MADPKFNAPTMLDYAVAEMTEPEIRAAALEAASRYRLSMVSEVADRITVLRRAEVFAEYIRTGDWIAAE